MKTRDLKNAFAAVQQESLESTEIQSQDFKNEGFIEFKPGNKYKFRLLWAIPEESERTHPFIYQCKHTYFDKNQDIYEEEICPVSVYWQDTRGFSTCPVCKSAKKAYKDWNENGIASAEDLYRTAKRKQNGYTYVYVVKDTCNPENEGTIKMMHMGFTIYRELMLKVFGVDIKLDFKLSDEEKEKIKKANLEDAIGEEAFGIDNGINLEITTTAAPGGNGWNNYDISFARKATDLSDILTDEFMDNAMKELKMDEKYYIKGSIEKLLEFNEKYILGKATQNSTNSDEIEITFDEDEEEETEVKPKKEVSTDPVDDLDAELDDLLNGLD